MKKLLSVLLCITMLMSGMSVFADTLDEFYGILEKNSFSDFSCNVKASMTLDAPIELLKLANDALADEEVYIDLTKVVGSVFETTLDMDMKLNSSSDFKKFDSEIDIKTNLPLVINDNFKITVDMQMDTYMSYDLTDEENPTFKFIFSVPIFDRYLVIDSNDLVGNEEIGDFYAQFMIYYANVLNNMSDFINAEKALLAENCDITKNGNVYSISISDKQFKEMMKDLPSIAFDTVLDNMSVLTPEEQFEFETQYAALMGIIENIQFLGENGIKQTSAVSDGKITKTDTSISVDMNIYDIISTILLMTNQASAEEISESLYPLTKENSRIAFTLNQNYTFKYDKESVKITIPELTEENSINIIKDLNSNIEDEYIYDDYSYDYFRIRVLGLPKRTSDGFPYIPVRQSFVTSGLEEENISWEKIGNESVVTVKGNETLNFEELKIKNKKDGESTVYIDGTQYTGEGAYMLEGKSYISASLFSMLIGYDYDKYSENIHYSYSDNYYMCEYYFDKYTYSEEEITDSDSFVEEEVYELPVAA